MCLPHFGRGKEYVYLFCCVCYFIYFCLLHFLNYQLLRKYVVKWDLGLRFIVSVITMVEKHKHNVQFCFEGLHALVSATELIESRSLVMTFTTAVVGLVLCVRSG